jgi:hypothetical protein
METVIKPIQDLGALIESRWRDQNYNEDLFSEIAGGALAEANLIEQIDPWEILRWSQTTSQLPAQQDVDGAFGNPPLTLYVGPRFYIDVYYWLDGTTTIHQHSFSGAFQVLLGSSIHTNYTFETSEQINQRLLLGALRLENVSLLKRGEIRQIVAGPAFIHSLFHLERPSATITVRTFQNPHYLPQYNYLRPYLAIDPFYKDSALVKKVQGVSLMLRMNHPDADSFINDIISCSDFHTTFVVLERTYRYLRNNGLDQLFGLSTGTDRFDRLMATARKKHGKLADVLAPVVAEQQRQEKLVSLRGLIADEEHRFLLALLLNVPDKAGILRLVQQRLPRRDPVDVVIEWILDLKATKVPGSQEPNLLGIDIPDDVAVFLLEGLWLGQSAAEMLTRAQQESGGFQTVAEKRNFDELLGSLKSSLAFRSIFADGQ